MKCAEAESWMKDKHPLVSSEDYGKDEDSTLALIKKHEVVQQDIEGYQYITSEIKEDSTNMIVAKHYAVKEIELKQVHIYMYMLTAVETTGKFSLFSHKLSHFMVNYCHWLNIVILD